MEENRRLVRPPFDSDGNVVWTTEEKPAKKKALRWWLWLIPIGLICVIGIGVLIYRSANRKTPQELCRSALRDAFSETFGYREPMMKAMHFEELADNLRKMPTDVGFSLQLSNTDMTLEDLGITGMGDMFSLSDMRGMGLGLAVTYDGKAVMFDTKFAVSALSLSVLQSYYGNGELLITSPKFISKVLTIPTSQLADGWMDSEAWSLVPESNREPVKAVIAKGIDFGKQAFSMGKSLRKSLLAAYPGGESALDSFVDSIRYEQLKDAKGKDKTERLTVGSEKVECCGFRILTDEEKFYSVAERIVTVIAGESAAKAVRTSWKLTPGEDGGNGVDVFAYVTKDGELAQLTAEAKGTADNVPAAFSVNFRCVGSDNPQDSIILSIKGDIGGQVYDVNLKKDVKADRSRVTSNFDLAMNIPGRSPIGLNGSFTYTVSGGLLAGTVNTVSKGKTSGTLTVSAECTYKNNWDMRVSELRYEDRDTNKYISLYGQVSVGPARYAVAEPTGERVPLLTMTAEQAQDIFTEAKNQLEWYYRQFFR